MKSGANWHDIKKIKSYLDDGKSVDEIAMRLALPVSCVESFAPKPKRKPRQAEADSGED